MLTDSLEYTNVYESFLYCFLFAPVHTDSAFDKALSI